MIGLFIILSLVVLFFLWGMLLYNALVRANNSCDEAWSNVDTELKRRYDLIPNLVEAVKAYATHERTVLQGVSEARTRAIASTGSPASQARDENVLVSNVRQLLAIVERYPELKADQNFRKLQEELINTEDRIQATRRFYSANVRDFNNLVQSVPSNLIAQRFGFREREYFEIENAMERTPVTVDLQRK
ncbi:MAG: hypothetical protein A2Z21_10615 [Candidatus Fraserbacteria bacterium RBG_16_55_9]|uniref:LemA family protein n=1 Tax=Fraserbacteria sp. (strain RBG_16_55_9) TaxID=1817864 RepID=A0A1F5UQC8_FRAXR|nr:MAG: hypothetical protein A2Z21_10615 [Candidatus Fraserbacteria bacterium RBG_16_55_9]